MPIRESTPPGAPIWIDLSSSDPDRAQEFYTQLFGWTGKPIATVYARHASIPDGAVLFYHRGALIAGMVANRAGVPDRWTTYLASADVQATVDAVITAGGQVLLEPLRVLDLGSMALVADPSGAEFGVWQPGVLEGYGRFGEVGAPAWLELHTTRYDDAVRFYRDAFDWQVSVLSDTPEFRYSTFEQDGVQHAGILDAAGRLPAGMTSNWQTYLQVADVDTALVRVAELGGTVLEGAQDSPYGRLAQAADPNGGVFKVFTPPRPSGP